MHRRKPLTHILGKTRTGQHNVVVVRQPEAESLNWNAGM